MAEQVADAVKKERLHRLMEVQNAISLQKNEALRDTVQEVLAEGPSRTDDAVWTGRTGTNKIVLWQKKGQETEGDIVRVRIKEPQTWVLKGELQ